ncbi:Nucleotidylyl transferase [Camillea tinctor]|nr:Nucleotidylyl transferase [Camillea tinctor]
MPPSPPLPNLVPFFTQALKNYQASGSRFRVLCSLPAIASSPSSPPSTSDPDALPPRHPPRSLLILDSSFNPPTLAHQGMVLSAASASPPPHRILLLLATVNADKAPQPATFPQRLAMMHVFARDLLDALPSPTSPCAQNSNGENGAEEEAQTIVDIAVTTEPYFSSKSAAIAASGFYPHPAPEQVFLAGFDTLVRIFNPRYYPPGAMRAALAPFFARARLRITARPGDPEYPLPAQTGYLSDGTRRAELAEWAGRVEIESVGEGGVSFMTGRDTTTNNHNNSPWLSRQYSGNWVALDENERRDEDAMGK